MYAHVYTHKLTCRFDLHPWTLRSFCLHYALVLMLLWYGYTYPKSIQHTHTSHNHIQYSLDNAFCLDFLVISGPVKALQVSKPGGQADIMQHLLNFCVLVLRLPGHHGFAKLGKIHNGWEAHHLPFLSDVFAALVPSGNEMKPNLEIP